MPALSNQTQANIPQYLARRVYRYTSPYNILHPPLGLTTCHQFQRDNYSSHNLPDIINPVRFVTFVVIAQEKVEIIVNIGGDLCFEPFSLTGVAVNDWSPGMDHERY